MKNTISTVGNGPERWAIVRYHYVYQTRLEKQLLAALLSAFTKDDLNNNPSMQTIAQKVRQLIDQLPEGANPGQRARFWIRQDQFGQFTKTDRLLVGYDTRSFWSVSQIFKPTALPSN